LQFSWIVTLSVWYVLGFFGTQARCMAQHLRCISWFWLWLAAVVLNSSPWFIRQIYILLIDLGAVRADN
jgi:hypothetical protein